MYSKPANKQLKRLKLELQLNTSSVKADLEGISNSYLGLALTDMKHTLISST